MRCLNRAVTQSGTANRTRNDMTTVGHEQNETITYRDAGVDIDAGNALVAAIKPLVKATQRPGADADLGGFGGLFDLA